MEKDVLFVSWDGMTDQLGQSQVIPYLRGLRSKGYRFTLVSLEKPEKYRQNGEYIRKLLAEYQIDWRPLMFHRKPPIIAKLYDKWKLTRLALSIHKEKNLSLVHCRSFVPADIGMALARIKRVPILYDMRGFWVDERVDNGQWNMNQLFYRLVYKRYKKQERAQLQASAHLISLTNKGKTELVSRYGVAAEKVTVIPCCVDLEHFDYQRITEQEKLEARNRLGIAAGDRVISYLGSLGGWYLTAEMLAFFLRLKRTVINLKFLIISQESRESIIVKSRAMQISDEDIIVQSAQRKDVPLFLSLSDWSLFFIKDAYSKKGSSPTKQGEIMAMGIPVICNDIGDTGFIVQSTNAGIVVDELNEHGFDKAISRMPELTQVTKSQIREGAEKFFDLGNAITAYNEVYKKII